MPLYPTAGCLQLTAAKAHCYLKNMARRRFFIILAFLSLIHLYSPSCYTLFLRSFYEAIPKIVTNSIRQLSIYGSISLMVWITIHWEPWYGIMWAGTGLAGDIIPLLMQWLLDTYGFRTALQTWSICLFVFTAPLLYSGKRQVPIAQTHIPRRFEFSFVATSTFGTLQLCNILVEALGFFLPSIYLPTYARSLDVFNFPKCPNRHPVKHRFRLRLHRYSWEP